MNSPQRRREFLRTCALMCVSGCGVAPAFAVAEKRPASAANLPPLRDRAYCGLMCDGGCPLLKASLDNDAKGKKDVFEKWHWREKFGVEFEAEKIFCFGCKPDGKPRGLNVSACTTRACATDRGLESCLQCARLAKCDKELWKNWPAFHQQMVQLQKVYVDANAFTLV